MVNILSLISLFVFIFASLSFLFLAYVAIRNDPTYKVNQLFTLAFIFAFFYFIFMGLYVLPTFSSLGDYGQYFAFLGLIFINLSIASFAFVSQYIQHAKVHIKQMVVISAVFLVGIIATYIVVFYFSEKSILIFGYILLNISLSINSLWFIIILFLIAKREKSDLFFKKKVYAYILGFVLFNILSGIGWSLTIFLSLGPDIAPLPPGILTLIASLAMARSFLMKKN